MKPGRSGVVLAAGAVVVALAGCGPAAGSPVRPVAETSCVTQPQATHIWTAVNDRLVAVELDPQHNGAAAVTTGKELANVTTYLRRQLSAQGLTEREVDRLDRLVVFQAGCDGGPLVLEVTWTPVRDDYLDAGGAVDHRDPGVGQPLTLVQEYVKSGGAWKESDSFPLDRPGPGPTPQVLRSGAQTLLYFA